MAKYGTFVKTEQFGSKFFCGKLVRSYKEPPIHFLEGKILNATAPLHTGFKHWWGSLCCVLEQGNLLSQSFFRPRYVDRYRGYFKPGDSRRRFTYRTDMNYRPRHNSFINHFWQSQFPSFQHKFTEWKAILDWSAFFEKIRPVAHLTRHLYYVQKCSLLRFSALYE